MISQKQRLKATDSLRKHRFIPDETNRSHWWCDEKLLVKTAPILQKSPILQMNKI